MSATATETTVTETTDTTDTTTETTVIDPTVAKLESQAARFITAGNKAGMSLAGTLVELYGHKPWEARTVPVVTYFQDTIGIGESGFTLPKPARQELVKRMADAHPDAPVAHMSAMTGASARTIANDRADLGVANPNRQAGQHTDDTDTDNSGDTTDAKPAKPSTKVSKINVLDVIDTLQDVTALMAIMAHATQRLTELTAAKPSAFTPAA